MDIVPISLIGTITGLTTTGLLVYLWLYERNERKYWQQKYIDSVKPPEPIPPEVEAVKTLE